MVPVPFTDLTGSHAYLCANLDLLGHRPVGVLLESFFENDGLGRLFLHATPRIFLFLVEVNMLLGISQIRHVGRLVCLDLKSLLH